ncbi:MAG: lasso peptide biosynthesis B2 protein [Polyangiaceae bacterium]
MIELRKTAKEVVSIVRLRASLSSRLSRMTLPEVLSDLEKPGEPMSFESARWSLRAAEALIRRSRVLPDTCLYRSLARYAVLRRTGRRVVFVMGIRRLDPREITGHAWLEVDGQIYNEQRDERLTETFRWPSSSSVG